MKSGAPPNVSQTKVYGRMTTIQTPPKKVDIGLRSLASNAAEDLIGGFRRTDLWGRMGWLDVKRRYQRTKIGPFWSSLTLAIYVLAVGSVGAGLWQQEFRVYLPYLTSGMLVWNPAPCSCKGMRCSEMSGSNIQFSPMRWFGGTASSFFIIF
jgi:hypothetical protein